ncbi:hypothetical protein FB451DRAFT_90171 [Mycena latifolia]|nr:hypothetical protein FB451DRAFT_90171 [Mycena latifolia]
MVCILEDACVGRKISISITSKLCRALDCCGGRPNRRSEAKASSCFNDVTRILHSYVLSTRGTSASTGSTEVPRSTKCDLTDVAGCQAIAACLLERLTWGGCRHKRAPKLRRSLAPTQIGSKMQKIQGPVVPARISSCTSSASAGPAVPTSLDSCLIPCVGRRTTLQPSRSIIWPTRGMDQAPRRAGSRHGVQRALRGCRALAQISVGSRSSSSVAVDMKPHGCGLAAGGGGAIPEAWCIAFPRFEVAVIGGMLAGRLFPSPLSYLFPRRSGIQPAIHIRTATRRKHNGAKRSTKITGRAYLMGTLGQWHCSSLLIAFQKYDSILLLFHRMRRDRRCRGRMRTTASRSEQQR